ncbi:unnamed protein product [Phytophthora lilii]|uniref:Unnamed protein product n=1 Tax=Phytophthora lilii TaxID=2077276 RepID=A0A9W6U6W8_9STRA|nr:unnamed protein product [Phytophthora lilii]
MERIQVCRESDQGTSPAVEFKYVRLLPFGEDITSKTIWEFVELGGLVTKANTCVAKSTTDMVGLVACHLIPLRDKGSVRVNVHTVIKRFAAEAGMAALVESRSEWSIESPTTAIYRSRTEEGGWVVVHEHPMQRCGLSDNATERASQLVTAIKLRPNEPQISNSANSCSLLTSAIVDVVIPSYRDLMSSQLQSVENFW